MRLKILLLISFAWLLSPSPTPAETEREPDQFITVNGVKLNYIDWGGHGETMVLLADFERGAGDFDTFAWHFIDRFHVVSLTRRGCTPSDMPTEGYDTPTRVEDLRQFLGALNLGKAVLVGEGVAGDELTLLATLYPQCVDKLVYLEPLDDNGKHPDLMLKQPGIVPWERCLLLEVIGSPKATKIKPALDIQPDPQHWAVEVAMHKAAYTFHPDYAHVEASALAIFGTPENLYGPKGAGRHVEHGKPLLDPWLEKNVTPLHRADIEEFRRRMPHGQVVELKPNDGYAIYESSELEIVSQIRLFLIGEPTVPDARPIDPGSPP